MPPGHYHEVAHRPSLDCGYRFCSVVRSIAGKYAEKIAEALRGGSGFIAKDAPVLDWPSTPGGEDQLLRQGSNERTCLPAISGYPHDERACFDPIFLRRVGDRTPQIDRVGISYMYFRAWQSTDRSWAHLMTASPNQDEYQGMNRDPSNGVSYVRAFTPRTELYLGHARAAVE